MSVRTVLLGGLVLALLALVGLWISRPQPAALSPGLDLTPADHPLQTDAAEPLVLSSPAERAPASALPTALTWTPSEEDLVGAWWVEGHVLLPAGIPEGEAMTLEARGRAFRGGGRHIVAIHPDGAFRLAFAPDTKHGSLHLAARFVAIDEASLDLPYAGAPLELQAELRGVLKGRIALSPVAEPRRSELAGTRLRLWSKTWSEDPQRKGRAPQTELAEDASFEFDALPAAPDWELTLPGGAFTGVHRTGIAVQDGKLTQIDLATQFRARLRGRVVDEAGAPLQGAAFEHGIKNGKDKGTTTFKPKSGVDGTFELQGVPLGSGWLFTALPGFLTRSTPLEDLAEGQVVQDLKLVLQHGQSILGKASWPDGQPAVGAQVYAAFLEDMATGKGQHEKVRTPRTKTDEAGRFRIDGVSQSAVRVLISAPERVEAGAVRSAGSKPDDPGIRWNAFLELDAPTASDLAFVLAPPCTIRGRVIDTASNPLPTFRIEARPVWRLDMDKGLGIGTPLEEFANRDGSFVVRNLFRTTYELTAYYGELEIRSTTRRIELPDSNEPVDLVLALPVPLSGVVVDARGAPVGGARVRDGVWDEAARAQCDAAGRFRFDHIRPGQHELVADAKGWARSKPLRVEVTAGAAGENLVLSLRVPGRIVGQVLGAGGRAESNRPVRLDGEIPPRYASSDSQGQFVFEELAAGNYSLCTRATSAESTAAPVGSELRDDSEDPSPRRASVRVDEGETASVLLNYGPGPRQPIMVRGHVTCAGKPIGSCEIVVSPMFAGSHPGIPRAFTAADGRFDVQVDGAGGYAFSLAPANHAARTMVQVSIDSRREVELALELPAGRIAGRTVDHEGRRVSGVRLELNSEGSSSDPVRGYGGSTDSDSQGRFQFEHVAPGSYSITGTKWRESQTRTGKTTQNGFVVRGSSALEDVTFVLLPGCRVEGFARRPDGLPAAGARVYVREESGKLWPSTEADPSGQFVVEGLPPGRYSLQALIGQFASQETGALELSPSGTTKIELALQQATDLDVQVLDSNGNSTFVFWQVLDQGGRDERSILRSAGREDDSGHKLPGIRCGPLAPGRYTLRCQWPSGASVEQELKASGEPMLSVTLRPPQ